MNDTLIREYIELQRRKKILDNDLSKVKSEMGAMHDAVLDELIEADTQRITIDGATVHIRKETWAKVVTNEGESLDEAYERATRALRECGLDQYVNTRFNTHSLSAYVREVIREGDEIPLEFEGAIQVTDAMKVGVRGA